MAMYRYKALTDAGRLMAGTIEAGGTKEARGILEAMNLSVQELETAEVRTQSTAVGRNEFLLFNQQLASITKAGIPLEQGLRQLARDAGSARMRRLIEEVADDLERGMSIEQAVEARQHAFPPLYGRILKAGIETGRLGEMLTNLNTHLEIRQRTRQIFVESITYPVVVFLISIAILTFMCIFIIPIYQEVVTDMSRGTMGLPWPTQFYLSVSRHILQIWIFTLAAAGISFLAYRWLSLTPGGRSVKEKILFNLPYLGRVLHSSYLARLAESMGLLAASGCTMPQCLRLGGQSSGSETIQQEMETLAEQVEQGGSVLEAGVLCRRTPMLFLYSLQIGIQRNKLPDHLHSLGQMYAQRTRSMQSHMQAALLPGMIILLGLFVGSIVLAMFLPMVKMVQVLM